MAAGETKLSLLNPYIGSLPDGALLYIVVDGVSYKATKADLLAGVIGGNLFSQLITIGETTIDGNDITIAAGTSAQIGANIYTTDDPQTFTIPFSSAGKLRTDIIVINTSGVLALVSGTEGDIAVQPAIPTNTVLVTKIEVAEDGIGAVPEPTYLTIDERAAITYANAPSEDNPFATMDDLPEPATPQNLPSVLSQGNRTIHEVTAPYTSQTVDKGRFLFVQNGTVVIDVDDAEHANGDELDIQNQRTNGLQITFLGSAVFPDSTNVVLVPPSGRILLKKLSTNNWNYSIITNSRILNLENILGSGFGSIMHVADTFEFVNGSGNLIYSLEAAFLNIYKTAGIGGKLSMFNLTDYRQFELPDEDGTVALQSYVDNIAAEKADLVGGLVPSSQLPAYVDDIIEGYKSGANFYEDAGLTVLITGVVGKIYVDLTSGQSSKQYRWTGSAFLQITNGLLASTNDLPEGSNLYFTVARVLSTVLSGLSASSGAFTSSSTILEAFGKLKYLLDNIATSSVAGIVKLYTSTGSNTDGTMDQNSISNAFATKVTFWGSAVDGTPVANTLTIEPTYSQLIPANTFVAGDVVLIDYRATSPGGKTSITNHYFYINSSNSLSGATQLAIFSTLATSRTLQMNRKLSVKGATTKITNPATGISTDVGLSASMTNSTIDWTVDQYLIFAIGHTVADQTMFGDFYSIQKM